MTEKPLRFERMSGLDERQLDELEYRVDELLAEAWDKGIGRPRELTLREALVVTCGYLRQHIIEEVWAGIFDVDQATISRYITFLTPFIEKATDEDRPTAEDAADATRDAIALVDGTLWPCWSWDGEDNLWAGKYKNTGHGSLIVTNLQGRITFVSEPAGSARPAGLRRCVTRLSTSPGRPSACQRCRRCLTVEAETGLPGTDSSAALARSRSRRLVRWTSYSGRGGVPAGMSGRVPSTTSMMWASHHRARSASSGGSTASPTCGPGPPTAGRISSRPLPASSATAASTTAPSSPANRTEVPVAPSTTRGRPSTITRSPALIPSALPGPLTPRPATSSRSRSAGPTGRR